MHIGNRIFPYPVLNRNEGLSDYIASAKFGVAFDLTESGAPITVNGSVCFKNLHYYINDASLVRYLEEGLIKGAFIVECSASVYRQKFEITTEPQDLFVPASEINGNVVASCYLFATQDISKFRSESFLPEYADYSFDIDKFDIVAVDDGYKFKIELDPAEDDKVASIFTIVKQESNSELMTCEYNEKRIIIHLPTAFYQSYDNIKMRRQCNNIAFSIIAIPALSSCLEDISSKYDSIEDILDDVTWFRSICSGYKKVTGNELTFEEFHSTNKLELSQIVLNNASCNGLKDFDNILLLGGMSAMDKEAEEE